MKNRILILGFLVVFLFGITSCWSARCPRESCRVQVEHRHGEQYFRPRAAFSWMYTPRYKHIRKSPIAAGPNQPAVKNPWYKFKKPSKPASKPR